MVLLRIEAGMAAMQVDAGELASAEIVPAEIAEPMILVTLAPSPHEDWRTFTSDAVGKRTTIYPCGELASEPLILSPMSGSMVDIIGPTEAELPRMVELLTSRMSCDGIS